MEKEQKQLIDFITEDGSVFKTYLTAKAERRKEYKRIDPKRIESIIPGSITELFIQEGDKVQIGTPLLVLESMKMGNLIKSNTEGIVKHIFVEKGKHISKGTLMIELE
ncbi:MAG: acetyl-CoA carboxylase biotin carboxyl carrier protein subunit [Paludibacteraceae bacterium]|nr:acetyl-CoA carboxylase biotin carboxyl carrier protein subunit [Paludibacteraceae bacterium]MBR4841046.1 acetyl-CoA carboxylase biotin carboxyl carrier protein subunit [Paludibacteraceae bacterium]